MVHYGGNVLTNSYKRSTKTTIHWIVLTLGGTCGAAGALIKMIQKGFMLQTIHGRLGESAAKLKLAWSIIWFTAIFFLVPRHHCLHTLPVGNELGPGRSLLGTRQETDITAIE